MYFNVLFPFLQWPPGSLPEYQVENANMDRISPFHPQPSYHCYALLPVSPSSDASALFLAGE